MPKSVIDDKLYIKIAKFLCAQDEPVKMKEIAVGCRRVKRRDAVPSSVGASFRLRLNAMAEQGLVKKTGERATTRYEATAKLNSQLD